ncbi:HAMP domain-containing sensor histidine kinase [uncultured Martelella sp.]|uniref:sensor histidine kinase n=1 Tax=uncultured Martelella sp. TaxID=392331 RepID=UPI0029C94D73|nr:HAMP domain-containing sensor histidine kinase [uncultured Martelella sp.]
MANRSEVHMKRDMFQRHAPQDSDAGPDPKAPGFAEETLSVETFRHALSVIEKGIPAVAIALVITAVGFLYIGKDLIFAVWAFAALVLHGVAFTIIRNAAREGRDAASLAKWNNRVIAAYWLAGGAWALTALLNCNACTGAAFPFFKGTMVIVALSMLALGAMALPKATWHVFMPAIIAFGAIAYQSRAPFDIGLAAALAVVMVFIAHFSDQLAAGSKALQAQEGEKDALNRRLTESLEKAEAAAETAEKANQAKAAFLAAMSHDLRTPLNAIIGFSEIMKEEMMGPLKNPYYREYASDIHSSGTHLLDMIDGVLDLSRLEAGGYRLVEQPVYLVDVIDASVAMVGTEAAARAISIHCDAGERLSPVMADGRAVKQMLINLLSNAIKFSAEGADILVTAGNTADGGQYLSVRDYGCGMDEAALSAATEAFSRGAGAADVEGFGLGLSIVRQLIEAHQGELLLQSTPGHGTLASIALPHARVTNLPDAKLSIAETDVALPLSPESAMPFVPESLEIETEQNQPRTATRSGRDRLAAALKRRARKIANDDQHDSAEASEADLQIEAQLEAEIIEALDRERESERREAANAA